MTLFFTLGAAICRHAKLATPKVSPAKRKEATQTTSEWAQTMLGFTATPKQAEVLNSTARHLILCCSRQWGKTTTIAVKALHHALTHANHTIVIISRTKRQAGILIHRACIFAATLGHRVRRVLGQSHSLQLPNQSQIFAVAHTTDTSVGNTANVLIVDEAAVVKDEVFFAVSPAIGRTRGAIWLLSTPRRQTGFFYNIWHDELPDWHKILSPVSDCPDIDPGYLEMHRRADETRYRQDYLCEFVQPPQFLFSKELIDNLWTR